MVKSYRDFLNDSNSNNRFRPNTDANEKEDNRAYLDVWKVNPSYKDVSTRETVLKATSLVVIVLLFFTSVLYSTYNLALSIGIVGIITISFIVAFHKNFFRLRHIFDSRSFEPFGDFVFWQVKYDKSVLFFTNHKELSTTGIRIFRINVLPENVHANTNRFFKGLHALKVPFSYQVIQRPLQASINSDGSETSSFETIIYFSTFYNIKGRITESKLVKMVEELRDYTISLESAFASNFHHFNIIQLSKEELINAFRIAVLKQDVEIEEDSKKISCRTETKITPTIVKASYILAIVICLDRLLLVFNLPIVIQALATLTILIAMVVIWWRELFFFLIKSKLFKSKDIHVIDPFSDIKFFKLSEAPETIFYQIEGKIIGGIKINNLYFTHPPPHCSASKFYEALIHKKMPFTTTMLLTPLTFHQFDKEGFKFLKDSEQLKLLRRTESVIDGNNWLNSRSGIWSTIMTYSTSVVLKAITLDYEIIDEIEQKLKNQSLVLRKSFKQFFVTYELKQLRRNELESGLLFETLKNKFFRRNGTHLNYLMFQGKTLQFIAEISDQFKKGVETRLAAEFNTPLQLTNFITVGHTINTEFLENEVPMGFTLEQLRTLLITNGTNSSREMLCQKIVAELVKAGYPSVIFDFTGNWSKLMRVFEGTIYEKNLLYHKLGKTFVINPLHSEIPYDTDNPGYLDYMFDAYALCFKKDDRTIETFKNTILRNPDIDVSTLILDLTSMREWEKSSITDILLAFFEEFTPQDMSFIHPQQQYKQEITPSYEFITQDKTVIIDLSEVKDYDKQCYFAFVVISKFIHYLKSEKTYYPKFLIVPHLDVLFDGFFLDKKMHYGKIDKFLEPFVQKGFGTICSTSQIRYVHPNAFNYFENIVTFKATDKRDSAVLSSLMNLEALHGTGYYSRSRNEGYQLRYIESMKKDEAVVKREDIYQPFPVEFNLKDFRETSPLSWEEIVTYMGKQGYDLENTEKQIIQRAEKTLFQKDFGEYSVLIEGIINFLNNLKKLDQVGNLYEQKVKKELTEWLHPYILKITKDKKREKEIKDKVFQILVRHRYLVESHPRRASGSESIQTSFAVGPHYDEALKDFYEKQKSAIVSYEPLDVGSDSSENSSQRERINAKNLKNAFAENFATIFYYGYFKMHQSVKNEKFEKSLKIGKNLLRKFLHATYNSYYSVNYAITSADIEKFICSITKIEKFPFSEEYLKEFLAKCEEIKFEEHDKGTNSNEIFERYSELFVKFKQYLEGEEEEAF